MYHILYVDYINQQTNPMNNTNNIIVRIESHYKNKYHYYSVKFENFSYKNRDNFLFSIYKDHNSIQNEPIYKDIFIDKDSIYLYTDKENAKHVDWFYIHKIWLDFLNNKKLKTEKVFNKNITYLEISFNNFYNKMSNKTYDITNLIKDIYKVKEQEINNKDSEYPKTILKEIYGY